MILAKIEGTVVATQKNSHLQNNRLLVAQPVDVAGKAIGTSFVAMDVVDAGVGDLVLVMKEGGSARIIFQDNEIPLQSVVVAVVDNLEIMQN
ncbi:MAG: EutN/CcmL family microcompartment protein [Candidatus Brocadiae bacterium]|nr:EutN/CcmL family microcompartment protein [Candidatus Brocadiia bacterium]